MKYYVVAEIGCNWWYGDENRSLQELHVKDMILGAAAAGFDAVKFQYYRTDEIRAFEEQAGTTKYTPSVYELIRKTELKVEDLAMFSRWAKEKGLDVVCTPFINSQFVNQIFAHVDRFKIRHRDRNNTKLIGEALKTGKVTYVSQTTHEYERVVEWSELYRQVFCIPEYPATFDGFSQIGKFENLAFWDGYSNHIPDASAVLLACAVPVLFSSAKSEWYLELHFKQMLTEPIDNAVSFDAAESKKIIDVLRGWEAKTPPVDEFEGGGPIIF